jgi:hypothetical protein
MYQVVVVLKVWLVIHSQTADRNKEIQLNHLTHAIPHLVAHSHFAVTTETAKQFVLVWKI